MKKITAIKKIIAVLAFFYETSIIIFILSSLWYLVLKYFMTICQGAQITLIMSLSIMSLVLISGTYLFGVLPEHFKAIKKPTE